MAPPSTFLMIAVSAFDAAVLESVAEVPAIAAAMSVNGVMFLVVVMSGSATKARNLNPAGGVTLVPVASSAIVVFASPVTTSFKGLLAQAVVQVRLYLPATSVAPVANWSAAASLLPQ